jgi:hypothetical protein
MAAVLTSEIEDGLQLIRLRQRRMSHVLLGLVPFILVAAYVGQPSSDLELYFIVAAAAYGVLMLVYSFRLAFTECPRCHGYFHCGWWLDPWTQTCLHCGLPLEPRPDGR